MAHTVQSVTLALTLPISCHICLGKVRQPVICVNHHVFCSVCIDLWLKNNNQCPVCRVAITPENPCKDIIGGASENEDTLSHSVRKHLRKTRFELLHKEYEDEIETLIKETDELRKINMALEERLTGLAGPVTMSICKCENKQVEDKNIFCEKLLVSWSKKLEMVTAANKKVTEDMEKLKEENRRLQNENIECARENLRLKNEVELRSPQKFGRFTVAALQSKVEQYEREMSRLKKALERSDQYIEELEEQIVQLKKPPEDKQMKKSLCGNAAIMEEHANRPATSNICQKSHVIEAYPEDTHEARDSSEDSKGPTFHSSTRMKQFGTISKLKNGLASAAWAGKEHVGLTEDSPGKAILTAFQSSPSSCLPFSSLQLNTPESNASSFSHANLKKPLTYLRKLMFDDLPKKQELGLMASLRAEQSLSSANRASQTQHTNSVLLNACHNNREPVNNNSKISGNMDSSLQFIKPGTNKALSQQTICDEGNDPETSSENSVDSTNQGDHGIFNGNMSHLPPNVFICQPGTDIGITSFQDNCTDNNDVPCASVYPERGVKPQCSSVAHPEHTTSFCLTQNYSNSPPAKRKLLNSCSSSSSKSSKN